MLVGVLALQGDVSEHVAALRKLLKEVRIVKKAAHLKGLKGLVIPGGESTTVGKLMVKYGLPEAIREYRPAIYGTCAGTILMAREIVGTQQFSLNLMDIKVERNAYGRQRESFESDISIPTLSAKPFKGVFIRAPVIKRVGENVEVLGTCNGHPVLVRQGKYLASTFHPELTGDMRIHKYFISLCRQK
jgi:5'-phosphate synthase pdxT subunit